MVGSFVEGKMEGNVGDGFTDGIEVNGDFDGITLGNAKVGCVLGEIVGISVGKKVDRHVMGTSLYCRKFIPTAGSYVQ